jgi:hypothetical protein
MNRREMIKGLGATALAASVAGVSRSATAEDEKSVDGTHTLSDANGAYAITMWDFSWIE